MNLRLVRREEVAVLPEQPAQRHRPALPVRVYEPDHALAHVAVAADDAVAVGCVRGEVVVGAPGVVQPEERDRGRGLGVGGQDVGGNALVCVAVGEEGVHLGSVGRVEVVGLRLAPGAKERDSGVSAGRH